MTMKEEKRKKQAFRRCHLSCRNNYYHYSFLLHGAIINNYECKDRLTLSVSKGQPTWARLLTVSFPFLFFFVLFSFSSSSWPSYQDLARFSPSFALNTMGSFLSPSEPKKPTILNYLLSWEKKLDLLSKESKCNNVRWRRIKNKEVKIRRRATFSHDLKDIFFIAGPPLRSGGNTNNSPPFSPPRSCWWTRPRSRPRTAPMWCRCPSRRRRTRRASPVAGFTSRKRSPSDGSSSWSRSWASAVRWWGPSWAP